VFIKVEPKHALKNNDVISLGDIEIAMIIPPCIGPNYDV